MCILTLQGVQYGEHIDPHYRHVRRAHKSPGHAQHAAETQHCGSVLEQPGAFPFVHPHDVCLVSPQLTDLRHHQRQHAQVAQYDDAREGHGGDVAD